jgi:thiamine-monophosphate kinase
MLLARSGQVRAMIDISDGLSSDALHIARASRTGVRIDAYCIPIEEETRAAARALKENSVHLALRSGEEFELLCAVDPSGVDSLSRLLKAETGTTLTPVGMITPASEGCHWSDGKETHVLSPSGFDHFKTDGKNS